MSIAVFGGTGFLGSYVVTELLERGHNVIALDIEESAYIPSEKFIKIDILDKEQIEKVFTDNKFDIVYNLAGYSSLDNAVNNPVSTFELNVIGNLNIIDQCVKHNVKHFVFASSAYAMSNKGSFYGLSKLSSEKIVEEYKEKFDLDYTILRYGSVYSDRDFETGIVYSDEYGRSSTVLVSEYNTVYVEPGNSVTANSIQVAISSRAPYWAERYKFVVKPSKGGYETIFSNFYYIRPSDNMVFFRLEGDNANKVQKGQTLVVKADVSGALTRVEKCEVLEISAEPSNFLNDVNEYGEDSFQLKGLYMLIKNQNFDIVIPEDSIIEFGQIIKRSAVNYF